ncbi:MAG: hypothetical protein ACTSYA_06915 [Candidatus Kariarchaeaceae archaeon]
MSRKREKSLKGVLMGVSLTPSFSLFPSLNLHLLPVRDGICYSSLLIKIIRKFNNLNSKLMLANNEGKMMVNIDYIKRSLFGVGSDILETPLSVASTATSIILNMLSLKEWTNGIPRFRIVKNDATEARIKDSVGTSEGLISGEISASIDLDIDKAKNIIPQYFLCISFDSNLSYYSKNETAIKQFLLNKEIDYPTWSLSVKPALHKDYQYSFDISINFDDCYMFVPISLGDHLSEKEIEEFSKSFKDLTSFDKLAEWLFGWGESLNELNSQTIQGRNYLHQLGALSYYDLNPHEKFF